MISDLIGQNNVTRTSECSSTIHIIIKWKVHRRAETKRPCWDNAGKTFQTDVVHGIPRCVMNEM